MRSPPAGDLRRFHTTVSKRFLAKLAAARDALSHSHPGADTATVLEAALDLLLAANLELDHIVPLARGGTSTASNLRVLCEFHNQLAARQAFGEPWMDQFTSRSRIGADEEGAPCRT